MILYYEVLFGLSVICFMIYFAKLNQIHDISYAFMFMFVVMSELGALIRSLSTNMETATIGNCISYIGGCFLQITITFLICNLCRIQISRIYRMIMVISGVIMYAMVLTDPWTHILYKTAELGNWNGITIINKQYGIGHTIFYGMVIFYFILNIALLLYGALRKKDASVKNIIILIVLETASIAVYFIQKFFPEGIQLTAAAYVISQIAFLIIMDRIALYNIDNTVIDALLKSGELGCFSFTLKHNYLGCNSVAEKWFPQLKGLRVDMGIPHNHGDKFFDRISHWMTEIDEMQGKTEFLYAVDELKYKITGGFLFSHQKVIGYQFTVRDCTQEQKYIELLNRYNEALESEVESKTAHIREMQDRLVLGMADMVESRDLSTGGHIKRTSRIVRILVDTMKEDPNMELTGKFCEAVIKAAPMHDLGKIAVDDSILRKPGRYTPEEFAIMKTHAKEGAVIVKRLLQNMDDDYFAQIAENVAHYHHERMDGTGYPNGLKGEEIPLEARIMAIADVYDALVSKRCYKDSMSFEAAYQIIEEGMGTQFDQDMNPYFMAAREKLEAFYTQELSAGV